MRSPSVQQRPAGSHGLRRLPLAPALGGVFGFAWFIQFGGAHMLDVTDVSWIIGDHAQHLLGWLFFRNDPWQFPLGSIVSLPYPIGTTVGLLDSNPWISVLLKPFSRWLPVDFQFIGPWLAACFVLQGVFAAKIMEVLTPSLWQRACGAALFVLAPPFVWRTGHDTLTAHWILLALVWLHLRSSDTPRRSLTWVFGLTAFAAGVHPYLAVMTLALGLALIVQMYREHVLSRGRAAGTSAALLLLAVAILGLFGYVGTSAPIGSPGFGLYSADMLTFFNSFGYSRWVPAFNAGQGQYEGFSYLGLGMMVLAGVAVGHVAMRRVRVAIPSRLVPLVVIALLLGVFAWSNHVTMAGHLVLRMRTFYGLFGDLVDALRSSGRFIWPIHYVIVAGILAIVCRHLGARLLGGAVLAVAVVLQVSEIKDNVYLAQAEWRPLRVPALEAKGSSFRHAVLYPPFFAGTPGECEETPFTWDETTRLAHLAYRHRLTFNSVYMARFSAEVFGSYCQRLRAEITGGRLSSDTLYVVGLEWLHLFDRPGVSCDRVETFNVCAIRGAPRVASQRPQMPQTFVPAVVR
jgi:hypothetical protein